MSDSTVSVQLRQQQDYQFLIDFGAPVPALLADEPPPLGAAAGPSPVQLLCAAVGNCLSDSLLFSLRKYRQDAGPLACRVSAELGRNAEGRMRVLRLAARLTLGQPAVAVEHLDRILDQFESFCTVTQSVRQGLPVSVEVVDATGAVLKS